MIKEEICNHERRITKEINQDKSHKKLWNTINTLRGKAKNKIIPVSIYNDQQKEIESNLWKENILNYWKEIYQQHENLMTAQWNDDEMKNYIEKNKVETENNLVIALDNYIPSILREHFDAVCYVNNDFKPMTKTLISIEDVIKQINKIKTKKISRSRWNNTRIN